MALLPPADPSQRLDWIVDSTDPVLIQKCGIGEIGCHTMKCGKALSVFLRRVLVEDDFRPNATKGRLQFGRTEPDHGLPQPHQVLSPSSMALSRSRRARNSTARSRGITPSKAIRARTSNHADRTSEISSSSSIAAKRASSSFVPRAQQQARQADGYVEGKNRFKFLLLEAGKLQHICVKSPDAWTPKNSESTTEKPVFLRQQEDALAKLIDETEDDRSKLICFGKASPKGIHRRRFRQSQRRCDLFQLHGANLYTLRVWREHRRRPVHMVRTGEDGQYCRNRCVRSPLRPMFFAVVR